MQRLRTASDPVRLMAVAVLLSGLCTPVLLAQETEQELRDEIEALKRGQEQIRRDLQEIKRLLQASRRPAPTNDVRGKVFDLGDNPVRGRPTAKLTLVEFTDYQ